MVKELRAATEPKDCHLWQLVRKREPLAVYAYSCSNVNYGLLIAQQERGSQQIQDIMTDSKGAATSMKWRAKLQASLEWICVNDVPAEVAEKLISRK